MAKKYINIVFQNHFKSSLSINLNFNLDILSVYSGKDFIF